MRSVTRTSPSAVAESINPHFDWHRVARLVLTSRAMDEVEEKELYPQKKIAYPRADPSACAVAPAARMTSDEVAAKRAYRVALQGALTSWMDTAGADGQGVDAVVYPGLLSDITLNDGAPNVRRELLRVLDAIARAID